VRGWLYFYFGGHFHYVLFNAHSAVQTPEGDLCEVTPSFASQPYPFIVAEESEEEYAAFVEGHGIRRLMHVTG